MRRPVVWLVMLLTVGGCGVTDPQSSEEVRSISQETFVEVYVALRRAQAQAPAGPAFEAVKRQILEEHDVTEEALVRYVEVHGRDLNFMTQLWEKLELRIASPDSAS